MPYERVFSIIMRESVLRMKCEMDNLDDGLSILRRDCILCVRMGKLSGTALFTAA